VSACGSAVLRRGRLVLGITLALFALPVALDLAVSGPRRSFGYHAADSFYYLTVARNISEHARVSYDGTHATNGFHPLWQLSLGAFYAVVEHLGASEPTILALVLLLNVALIAVALALMARVFARPDGSLTAAFALFPIGAYGALLAPLWLWLGQRIAQEAVQEGALPLYGTLWSYVNGMESACVLLAFSALFHTYVARGALERVTDGVAIGLLLATLTFARLDHVFLPLVLLGAHGVGWVMGAWRGRRRPLAPLLAMVGGFAVPLAAYLANNRIYFGAAMPVSGSLKSTFPLIDASNWVRLRLSIASPVASPVGRTYREAQLVIPVLFALFYLPFVVGLERAGRIIKPVWQAEVGRREQLLLATGAAVTALALYNQLFVALYHQGHWYVPLSTTFCSLVVISVVDRVRTPAWLGAAWLVTVSAASIGCFVHLVRHPGYHSRYADFYFDQAPRLRAFYGAQQPCFFEADDGIFAYATRYPSLSGTGLNLDAEGAQALKQGRLIPLAVERGCGRITSVVYPLSGVLHRDDATRYHFSVEYRDGDIVVFKVDPKT